MSRGGVSFGYSKINFLQALSWWVMDLTLWVKRIDLNSFKSDFLSDTIEESQLDFEYNRDGKEELGNPK